MAQTGKTPIQLYHSTTADAVPTADNLIDGELALNSADGKLFYKDSGGTVQEIGGDATLATLSQTISASESATLTLSSSITAGAPIVSATKEVSQTGVTNNSWDAAAGSYVIEDSAYDTSLSIAGFDVSTASFVDSFSVAAQETNPRGIAFNTDGTKMFILGGSGQDVNEYTLSTGFDVSTASFVDSFSVAAQDTFPRGIAFNTDGTKMFIVGTIGQDVNEYTLSTGFDVSTSTFVDSFSVSAQDTIPYGIAFNTDGTKMFIVGGAGDDVNEYTLSTGFDVSTASFVDSFSVAAQETNPYGIAFNANGTKMFIVGAAGQDVNEYTLSTGFDVSTATFVDRFSVAAQDTTPFGIAFNTNGTKMFIVGNVGDSVYEYTIPLSLQLGTGSFASADVGKTITINDGSLVLTATDGSYVTNTAPSSLDTAASGEWSMTAVVYDPTDDVLKLSGLGYQLSSASFVDSFSVASQDTTPFGIAFNTNGTKMFIVGGAGDDVNEYTLSTEFDVSTASFVDSFSVAAQETNPFGIAFNTDGTKMFIAGYNGDDVNEYTLSTGFDVSTASFVDSFSVAAQDTTPFGIAFNTNGTKMFIVGGSGQDVNEYTLSTGFDVSTASFVDSFSVAAQDTSPYGIAFNTDGTKMFIVGGTGQDVNEYTLSTGFDVSTASFVDNFSVASQDIAPYGIAFNTNGTKMFIGGSAGQDVNEYTLSKVSPSGNHPCISKSIDSTYWTDINSLTATNTGTNYHAISNDNRGSWSILSNTNGVRDIVRDNAGTWQYNSNATYGSETWTNATANTEVQALKDAVGVSVNQMTGSDLNAITDANQITLGNDLSFAVIFYSASDTYSGTAINYDANTINQGAVQGEDYTFDFPATDKVRITAINTGNYKVRVG